MFIFLFENLEKIKKSANSYEEVDGKIIFYDDSGEEIQSFEKNDVEKEWSTFRSELNNIEIPDKQNDSIPRTLSLSVMDKAIIDVKASFERNKFILNPEWQRNYVWGRRVASLLIESLILDIPVPPIYLAEVVNSNESISYEVVDGRQRLTSILDFMNGEFKLRGLSLLSDLNGVSYNNLPNKYKDALDERTIRMTVIKKESDEATKLDLFFRINTGSSKLSKQEVRNAHYLKTSLQKQIKKFVELECFSKYVDTKSSFYKRFKHYELVARMYGDIFTTLSNDIKYEGSVDRLIVAAYSNNDDSLINSSYEILNDFFRFIDTNFDIFKNLAGKTFENNFWISDLSPSLIDAILINFVSKNWTSDKKMILDYENFNVKYVELFAKANPSIESQMKRLDAINECFK